MVKTPLSTPDVRAAGWRFDNSYDRLPAPFHSRVKPTPVEKPQLVVFNRALALELGLDPDALEGGVASAVFAGNELPTGAEPIAQAYADHQFGNLTRLGDGRAILLGEHLTPSGKRFDIQLKGSGPTPYSRRGDGRAALGPMLREYVISEAMHGLGIPTTRSLAVVTTGEPVFREEPLQGAVLTRVAASHIRVGTFELFAALGDTGSLGQLCDHTLRRHFADRVGDGNPALALLHGVLERQAILLAHWLRVGFVHGVMNTDNMALSGETLDYGPCAFIDAYDPGAVFSSIDHNGRYAFGAQPRIAGWNLARFAEALLPLLHPEPEHALALAQEALATFEERSRHHWLVAFRAKLGLFTEEPGDLGVATDLLLGLHRMSADHTHTFRGLVPGPAPTAFPWTDPGLGEWHRRWNDRLARQPQSAAEVGERMRSNNPAVIPRNHVVEAMLHAAVSQGDFDPFHRLLDGLADPYVDAGKPATLTDPPPADTPRCRTFCGT